MKAQLFVVRHIPSRRYIQHGRGSRLGLTTPATAKPRIFGSRQAAAAFVAQWAKGIRVNNVEFIPQPERLASAMQIVPIEVEIP